MHTHLKVFITLLMPLLLIQGIPKENTFHKAKVSKTKIAVNNIPLAKINGKVISLADVVKELDLRMYLHNPEDYKNPNLRFGFYKESWKRQLDELVHLELLRKEADERKLKVTDADVRQELVSRYGNDIVKTLHEVNFTYEDVKNSVRNDVLAQQMNWFGYINKAFYKIGPQTLKTAYDEHVAANPGTETWKYQFLTVRVKDKVKADQITFKMKALDPSNFSNLQSLKDSLISLFSKEEEFKISISDQLSVDDKSIAPEHKTLLASLPIDTITPPICKLQNNEYVIRLFQLKDHIKSEPMPFSQMSDRLRSELISKVLDKDRQNFFQRLKDKYGYSDEQIYIKIPEGFEPFSLKEE